MFEPFIDQCKRDLGNITLELQMIAGGLVRPEKQYEAIADLQRRQADLRAILDNAR